ncbi:hypothetical protein ACEQPO_05050 [Bacillus sp. SL00103]
MNVCLEALEDAGCDPDRMAGKIGVYTGTSPNHEWLTRCPSNGSN